MGISRDSRHKHSATGAQRAQYRKKRKFELGRPPAGTKIAPKERIHMIRTRGGNHKYRALRLHEGHFSWGTEGMAKKTRLLTVVYNASNNELVRTNTLVKGAIVQIDASPFRVWYESYYAVPLGKKSHLHEGAAPAEKLDNGTTVSEKTLKSRQENDGAKVEPLLEKQFDTGRLYAIVTSRPGQSGRCDGYILEGKELEFYEKKIKAKK